MLFLSTTKATQVRTTVYILFLVGFWPMAVWQAISNKIPADFETSTLRRDRISMQRRKTRISAQRII